MVEAIQTTRRTLASCLDDSCARLDSCPPIPPTAVRNALTGGYIVINGMQRWRQNAAGETVEYMEWKLPEERLKSKSVYKNVWWKE